MQRKMIAAGIVATIGLVLLLALFGGLVGHNDVANWQVLQYPNGTVQIVDEPGYYGKWFGKVWTYPRTMKAYYSAHQDEGGSQSIRVTFNDGGTAEINSYVMVQLPSERDHRLTLHQNFGGNPPNILDAIRSHLVNCIKASGPVMSASENQASRKAEFNQIVEEQLAQGLFKMRRTEIELSDMSEIEVGVDAQGNKTIKEKRAKVQATEIVTNKHDQAIVIQPSPLAHYGIAILQFSVTETEYDQQTLSQFAAKKESYLKAEQAKAQRQEEVQQRLMIEERGRRQVAEIQASENQEKERATIRAQKEADVAVIDKEKAVTQARQKTEVAQQAKQEAETLRQIAEIQAQRAELDKQATISAAEGKQKEIELGGGISEEKRVLAEIAAKRDAMVAEALSKLQVPGVMFIGGTEKSNMTENLLNMALLKSTGVLKDAPAK